MSRVEEISELIQSPKKLEEWFQFFLQNEPVFSEAWDILRQCKLSDSNKYKVLAVALAVAKHKKDAAKAKRQSDDNPKDSPLDQISSVNAHTLMLQAFDKGLLSDRDLRVIALSIADLTKPHKIDATNRLMLLYQYYDKGVLKNEDMHMSVRAVWRDLVGGKP